jgi:glycosyltransferase involved in cell wall biosynthesis
LIQRKGVDTLLKELAQLQHLNWSLTIVGDGIERKNLEEYSNSISNEIEFKGNVSNEKVFEIFSNADLMLCPSQFDGWGAVVNEALTVGTPVLVSNNCGASVLVDGIVTGESFSFETFGTVLEKWIIKRDLKQHRKEIIDWTHSVMNGDVASDYFLDILKSVDESDNKPKAPWF